MVHTADFEMYPASPVSVLSLEMFSRVCCDLESACNLDSYNSSAEPDVPYFRDSLDYNTCDSESACWEAELACSPIWIDEARSRIRSAALAVVETQQQSLHLTSLADSNMHEADLFELDVAVNGGSCVSPKSSKSSKAGVFSFIAASLRLRK